MNTYAYVGGNPVNAIDPYGLCDSGYAWKSNGMRGECVPESEAGYLPGNAASDAANICPIPIVKGVVIAGTLGRSIIANATKRGRKFWTNSTTFQGNKVFQRNDLIDSKLVDRRGRSNLQRMQKGLAPIGPDGKSMNLHHMTQRQNGGIAEMTQSFHQKNSGTIHINPSSAPSGIDVSAEVNSQLFAAE